MKCVHCGRDIESDDGIWYHPDTMSARCDGPDDEPGLAWSDMIRQATPKPVDFVFVELGEGYEGEYDPTDPEDVEFLRLDYMQDGEEVESLCTNLPVSLTAEERERALDMVRAFAARPRVGPRTVVEVFSWADPSWLDPSVGVPANVLELFNLTP